MDRTQKLRVTEWAEAEGCETGEVMQKMLSILEFSDYVPSWYLEETEAVLLEMQEQLNREFTIDSEGMVVAI